MAYLLEPLKAGNLEMKNRLVMAPMATAKSEGDGKVTQEIIDYYDEKSKGGYISLIILEHSFVSKEGMAGLNQVSVADDSTIEGLSKIADIIHKNGSKAVVQINHAGSAADEKITGMKSVGASAVANPRKGGIPAELSKVGILEIVKKFKDAAVRVKQAGFDGVEVHSAHGYFLNQFLSPLTNKRTDEYGGNIRNRIKIHLDIIKAIKEAVGDDYPILIRIGASDYQEGGTTIEDSKIAALEFEKAGVDIIDVSGGFCGYEINGGEEEGYFNELTEKIKKVVSVPVILTGGIKSILVGEDMLKEGKADLIGVGRTILKDSGWAKKAVESLI